MAERRSLWWWFLRLIWMKLKSVWDQVLDIIYKNKTQLNQWLRLSDWFRWFLSCWLYHSLCYNHSIEIDWRTLYVEVFWWVSWFWIFYRCCSSISCGFCLSHWYYSKRKNPMFTITYPNLLILLGSLLLTFMAIWDILFSWLTHLYLSMSLRLRLL